MRTRSENRKRGNTEKEKEIKQKKRNKGDNNKEILTGKELKDARDGEPLSFAEGEELSNKHKDA